MSVLAWLSTHGLLAGRVQVGGSVWLERLAVLPAVVGLCASLVAVASAPVLWARGRLAYTGAVLMAVGQILTWALVGLCFAALHLPRATGWELLGIGPALVVGQSVVAAGLLMRR